MTELVDKDIKIGMWGTAHPPMRMTTEESMSMKRTDMEDKKKTQLQVSDEKLLSEMRKYMMGSKMGLYNAKENLVNLKIKQHKLT